MRKIASFFCGIIATACLITAPICFSAKAEVSPDHFNDNNWWGKAEDITFKQYDLYTMENAFDEMPKTIEALIQLDESRLSAGGTILGNIDSGKHVTRDSNYGGRTTTNEISLEIDTKGRPKLYHKDDNGDVVSVLFNADVRGDEFVHLTVTRDENTAYCYLDGVLADSVEFEVADFVSDYPFAIGNDFREARSNYFKGKIRSVSVYSDMRTETEIAADVNAIDYQDEDLMASYNLEGKNGADFVKDRSQQKNNLTRKWLFEDVIDEPEYDYSFMVLGDTQALNYYRQGQQEVESFNKLYDYIKENAAAQKVAHVFHVGDITQKAGTDSKAPNEFADAKANYEKLDNAGISYSIVAGNHDFSSGKATNYIKAFGGSENAYAQQYFAAADESTALTTAHKFTAGELDYLVIAIGWNATKSDILWADKIISNHPYHNVIIATHAYKNQKGNISSMSSYIEEGEYDWVANGVDLLAKHHANVVLTLNGHTPTTAVERFVSYGAHGNLVTHLVIDPTYFDGEHATATVPHFAEGAGMIANLRFSEGGKKVSVSWFSSVKEKYYNSDSVYTFEIPTIQRQQINVAVKGNGGRATSTATEITGEPFDINVIPDEGYRLAKLTVGGIDVTADVVNNVYTVREVVQSSGAFDIVAEFDCEQYKVTVENEESKGTIVWYTEEVGFEEGKEVSFAISLKSGWKLKGVTFNGAALQAGIDGTYTVTITDGDNLLRMEYAEVEVSAEMAEVRLQNDAEKGDVVWKSGAAQLENGGAVSFTVTPKEGWTVASVTFNGAALEKDAEGYYVAVIGGLENVIQITYEEVKNPADNVEDETQSSDDGGNSESNSSDVNAPSPSDEKDGNVFGTVFLWFGVGLAVTLIGGAVTIFALKRRKK